VPIRLSDERWRHILKRHPELQDQKEKVLDTLASPDLIQEGDVDTLISARHYSDTPVNEKFLVVVYREVGETDGFVLTAYFTNEPSGRRRVLWSR
jgi:hypothetical protein